MSGASERANGRASGPVRQSVFLAVFDHSAKVGLTCEEIEIHPGAKHDEPGGKKIV